MAEKTVSVRLIARVGQYASEMNQAAGATSSFAGSLTGAAGKAQGAVTKLGAAAAMAGKITLLGIGAAMVVSAKAAIDFESSLTGVAKTTDLAGASLSAFGRQIRDLSLEIPVNVNELNRIAELGGQLGISTPNLISFTDTIAKLGVTTNLATEEAATGLARFVNIMGANQSEIATFGSIIVELGNNFATTEQEILHFGLRLAPIGQAVNMSEAGVLALGTALSSLGITAERGSTAVQRILLDMQNAVQSNSDELQNWARIAGTSVEEFAAAFRRDPMEALLMVARGLDQVVDSGGNVFSTLRSVNIQEQRAIGVALALANGHEVLADAYEKANEQTENANALNREAALRFGTTESQIALVANAFNDLRIEIGNAFLDTGALTGFLTTMRELFGIMRDNTEVMGAFAAVLAGLSVVSIANFFGIMIRKGLEAAHTMGRALRAADGLGKGMVLLRNASAGLNIAFGIVGIAATVLGAIWIAQAAKAARLKQAVEELNIAVENGADPMDVLAERLREALDVETVERLQNMGISVRDLAEDIANGGNMLEGVMAGANDEVAAMAGSLGGLGDPGARPALIRFIEDLGDAAGETGDIFDAFRRDQVARFVDDFRELNPETKMTTKQIRDMAEAIQRVHGADLTGWAQRTTDSLNFIDPAVRRAIDQAKVLGETLDTTTTTSFVNHLLALENGADIYADFTEGVSGAVTDFRDTITEAFSDIADSIYDSKPAWDEYGEAVEINVGKMLEAREKFLVDLRSWVDIQPQLLAQASAATLAEIDSWTLQEKAAFAALDDQRRTTLIEGMNEANNETALLIGELWRTRIPSEVQAALPELLAAIKTISDEIAAENPGLPAGQAWVAGVEQAVMEFSDDPLIQNTMMDILTDPTMLQSIYGWSADLGFLVQAGLIYSLSQLGDRAAAVMAAQMEQIKNAAESEVYIDSPSRWAMYVGTMMGEGLRIGLHRSMTRTDLGVQFGVDAKQAITRAATMPVASMTSVASTVANSHSYGGTNITIPIINPESKDLNRAVDKARNKINALVPMIERHWRLN